MQLFILNIPSSSSASTVPFVKNMFQQQQSQSQQGVTILPSYSLSTSTSSLRRTNSNGLVNNDVLLKSTINQPPGITTMTTQVNFNNNQSNGPKLYSNFAVSNNDFGRNLNKSDSRLNMKQNSQNERIIKGSQENLLQSNTTQNQRSLNILNLIDTSINVPQVATTSRNEISLCYDNLTLNDLNLSQCNSSTNIYQQQQQQQQQQRPFVIRRQIRQPQPRPVIDTNNYISSEINNSSVLYEYNDDGTLLKQTIQQSQPQQSQQSQKQSEYQIVLHVGNFNIEDISVQLIHESENRPEKKIVVHCYRIEPIHNLCGNFLKKEFKRELILPTNSDSNTVESFFHNEMLTIKCKLKDVNNIVVKPYINNTNNNDDNAVTSRSTSQDMFYEQPKSNDNYITKSILKSSQMQKTTTTTTSPDEYSCLKEFESKIINQHESRCVDQTSKVTNQVHERHRSSSRDKSVRFDLGAKNQNQIQSQTQTSISSNTNTNTNPKLPPTMIRDGFNCLTKDSLDTLYLTYFFKLPACSPSDRTQAKIENSSILKLKIIQEKKLRDVENSVLKNDTQVNSATNDNDKIILREFSRRCRLPTNLFKFDEGGVTVSFVNDVLVKVDIPIKQIINQNDLSNIVKSLNGNNETAEAQSFVKRTVSEDSLVCNNSQTENISFKTEINNSNTTEPDTIKDTRF